VVHRFKLRLMLLSAILIVILIVLALAADVMAIVGRPATPLSYAGVARRTVRRAYY
jgi:hypothetical protein